MPATPLTARKSAHVRRSVTTAPVSEDVAANPSGLYQANTIQDRIKQWQVHGAAYAPAPDAVSVRSATRSCTSRPQTPEQGEGDGEELMDIQPSTNPRGRSHGRQVDPEQQIWIRKGRASTPRKRVVSDGHWRIKDGGKHAATVEAKEKKPIEKVFLEAILPNQDVDRTISTINKARAEREERRRRRKESRARKAERTSREVDDDSRARTKSVLPQYSPSEIDDRIPDLRAESRAETHVDSSPRDDEQTTPKFIGYEIDEDDNRSKVQSRYAETLGQPPQYDQEAPLRSKKGSILNRTKELFGMNEPYRTVSNRLPSIEAWLDDQPDPFHDENVGQFEVLDVLPEVEVPEPLKKSSTRRKVSIGTPRLDPNKIWDALNTAPTTQQSPQHGGTPNIEDRSPQEADSTCSSPVTLRRRGARPARPRTQTLSRTSSGLKDTIARSSLDQRTMSLPSSPISDQVRPRTGLNKLSTIASVETFGITLPTELIHEDAPTSSCTLNRKLTTHEDLMSELARPRSSRSMRKARSTRVMNRQPDHGATQKILDSMKEDEVKYSKELRTLVDGVIPVLLQCVLSKHESIAAAGLFTSSGGAKDDLHFTRPIIDMGVSLERLKSLHNRIPLHNIDSLLSWCQTAHKAYTDYLKAWRLGFQDVIVNLAPLEGSQEDDKDIMERDQNGDVINADGEKVDVAFLLKRPLVRIRKLGKDLNNLKEELKTHPVAARIAEDYVELTAQAKRKHSQEQGRLEDEAAANIDATRVRDIRTMGPLTGVVIDKNRRVRARDTFDMELQHSNGQIVACHIELILRDNDPNLPQGGDVLICAMDQNDKWLLFAPIGIGHVSARRAESASSLVIMIRGAADLRSEWHELLGVTAESPEAAADWMNMLGSNPLPPKLNRIPGVRSSEAIPGEQAATTNTETAPYDLSKVPNTEEFSVPIGEPSIVSGIEPRQERAKPQRTKHNDKPVSRLNLGGGLQHKGVPEHWQARDSTLMRKPAASSIPSSARSMTSDHSIKSSALSSEYTALSGQSSLQQTRYEQAANIHSSPRYPPQVAVVQPLTASTRILQGPRRSEPPRSNESARKSDTAQASRVAEKAAYDHEPLVPSKLTTPIQHESRQQIVHGGRDDQSTVPNVGPQGTPSSPASTPLTDTIRERWTSLATRGRKAAGTQEHEPPSGPVLQYVAADISKTNKRSSLPPLNSLKPEDLPPQPPRYKEIVIPKSKVERVTASHTSEVLSLGSGVTHNRLSSSPLKHEYAPSTDSDSAKDFESEYSDDDSSSETSEGLGSEMKDEAMSLPDMHRKQRMPRVMSAPQPTPTTGTRTLAPSDSASQGPYRRAPPASAYPADKKKRAMALVCSWSDTAMWQPLCDEECSVIVSPGLVEVFTMTTLGPTDTDEQPLLAFEITPIVPLHGGCAVDVTIRARPTANSQIQTCNNYLFRSRTIADMKILYSMLHWSRLNNPTWIELERSRPRPQPVVTFSSQQSERPKSWFSFGSGPRRRNSYRAGSMPPPSIQESTASSGTMSGAISALKRLSKNSAFSINRSSVIRRPGRGTDQSLYSSSGETNTVSGSGASTPAPATQIGHIPGKDGPNVPETSAAAVQGAGMINNMKIEFHIRNGNAWAPIGSARLSVLPAPAASREASRPASSSSTPPGTAAPSRRNSAVVGGQQNQHFRLPSSSHTPHRIHGNGREKRIVITKNKKPDVVLFDETLGESCFEIIMKRGIAMQTWKEDEQIGHKGGVLTGRGKVYLMSFSSESEAKWVFGLVGTYRYGFQES